MAKLTVDQALLRAKSLERKGENEEARALYQSVLQNFPGNPTAREALARLGQAAASGPSPPQESLDHLLALYHQGQLDVVAAQAERLAREFPASFLLWNILGASCAQIGKAAIAEQAFRRATELKPDFPDAFSNLGNILKDQGRLEEAVASFTRAIELNPGFAEAHGNLGNALRNLDRLDEASASFARAIALKPDHLEAHCNLFELFEKSNCLDSAREVLENARKVFPVFPPELRLRSAAYHFRLKEFDAVIAELQGIGGQDLRLTSEIKRQELLAKSLEKTRRYADAFLHMRRMNELIHSAYPAFGKPAADYLENIERRKRQLQSAQKERPSARPAPAGLQPVFLVGFPRSGTTLLDAFLRGHPRIEVVEEKPMLVRAFASIDEFSSPVAIESLDAETLDRMRGRYFDELGRHLRHEDGKTVVDKLPLNLTLAPEMHALFPDARYILALRHPLDCLLSNYKQNFKPNVPMYLMSDLAKASALYDAAMSVFHLSQERYGLAVHRVRYEDLTQDTEAALKSLVAFLGLEWDADLLDHRRTAAQRQMINTPSYSQVVEGVYRDSNDLWRNYEAELRAFTPGLRRWMEEFGYR
ncbi:MAG: sulfotransferase [Gammaproteobacteria bacterium]|nr:sulfotransferase [Gammaproteobacteria bacterium]